LPHQKKKNQAGERNWPQQTTEKLPSGFLAGALWPASETKQKLAAPSPEPDEKQTWNENQGTELLRRTLGTKTMAAFAPGRQPKLEARLGKSDRSAQRKESKRPEKQGPRIEVTGVKQVATKRDSSGDLKSGPAHSPVDRKRNKKSFRTQSRKTRVHLRRCKTVFSIQSSKITIDLWRSTILN
jgi:hypothetical protein